MNEIQSIVKTYILIVKTLHGDPGDNVTVIIKGTDGQTEKLALGKSQSHQKTFRDNQTDLFLLVSNIINIGKISQIEFYPNIKFKEWKYNNIFIMDGIHVYRDLISIYSLVPSTNSPSIVNVSEPYIESQESIYYAFIKTGNDSCSKGCYPKLSLFGNNQQHTEIDMKSSYRMHSLSINNNNALEKHQFDIFQWQDHNIGTIERMHLQLYSENKQSKCQWPIDWMFVIHHKYSFTGRIMLNRIIKINRFISIDFEQKPLSITGEHGDSFDIQKKYDDNITSLNFLNKQSNATSDDIGRYYVIIRNLDGTTGDVYINFHGDDLTSSGEQHLSKSENYPDHPFISKHTDLFHIKALEIGHIHSVSIRLDETTKEHSLTLDLLYIIHNSIVYEFDLKYIILNKEQSNKEFIPRSHPILSDGKASYYIATHTADKMLSGTNASFQIVVKGTNGIFGPIELKESLTNDNDPFEKECVDLFHIEDIDIGDPLSVSITLESKGLLPSLFSGAKCERIMFIKNGEYNSLWQLVGDLKSKEAKTISLPIHQQQTIKKTPQISNIPPEPVYFKTHDEPSVLNTTNEIYSSEIKPLINNIQKSVSIDNLKMAEIEDHQKRHTFAPSLYQAQQNYRELRRLLKKMNGPIQKETKTRPEKLS
ncbi:unnamed protein product [Adineta steineri]|uniref:PLAT domain-containing protein n=1 Tax=Adineta steineri TaxID=433720 RepID=A0A818NUM6_9BILA|nr:unnamed protein product [Adineta steineri]